jgi:phosphoglucosamine mutase
MRQLFGTDGIRGVANVHPMTPEVALSLGRAVAYLFKRQGGLKHRKIVVGKDTRRSCYMFENALAAGIASMGADCLLCGPLPTPGVAHVTSSMRADAGVMVSASHNAYEDNGIKIFGHDGFKLPDEAEAELEELIVTDKIDSVRPVGTDIGRARRIEDAIGRYIVYLKTCFPDDLTLDGVRVVIDCANGASYRVAPAVFAELGAEVITLGVSPDGTNINDGVGSLHPRGHLQEGARATRRHRHRPRRRCRPGDHRR